MGESKIKRDICDWLDSQGFYTVLNVVTNKNGLADVTVYCPGARVFLLETKDVGEDFEELQKYRRDEIFKKVGTKTFKVDSLEQVKQIVSNGEHLPDKS